MPATATKRAHPSCQCEITPEEKYCSQICKDAGSQEIEIGCECGHPACEGLTRG